MRTSKWRIIVRDMLAALALTAVPLGVCEFVPALACPPALCIRDCCACVRPSDTRAVASPRRGAPPTLPSRALIHALLPVPSATLTSAPGPAPKPRSGFDRFSDWARAPSLLRHAVVSV
jgi:hypothetical protein